MMKSHIFILLLLTVIFINCVNVSESTIDSTASQGDLPWEKAFLKAAAAEVIRASETIELEKEEDARILYREIVFKFDEQGRLTRSFKIVYKILNANGITYWSSLSQSWDPWYQERPILKGRVCNPDGNAYFLKSEHIVESAEKEEDINIFSERRFLRAPLPNVTIGSVIEVEYILQEKNPYFRDGIVQYIDIRSRSPMHKEKIIIEVPKSLAFHYRVFRVSDVKPDIKDYNNNTRYTFSFKNIPPEEEYEIAISAQEPFWPCIAFASGESWNKIAESYIVFINEALKGEDFSQYLTQLKAQDVKKSAVNIIRWLNERVRYTGLELGINSIVPVKPSQTLERGFGDCKDKATLVVGMLRQMGYKADVALVYAGFGIDVNENLPGLGHFNHAIVYVNEEGGLWFDPTDEYSRDFYLPLAIQNKKALIANSTSKSLTKIPKFPAEANKVIRKKEFFLQNEGKAKVIETTLHYGAEEEYIRSQLSYISKEKLNENIGDYINAKFGSGTLEELEITDSSDLSVPFQIQLKINEVERGATQLYLAQVLIHQAEIFSYIPQVFVNELEEDRRENYIFYQPSEFEIQYIIHPPLGFACRKLPDNETVALGTMTLEKQYHVTDHNDVLVTIRINSGKDEITPDEFMTIYKDIDNFLKQQELLIEFDHKGLLLLKKGDYKESLAFFYKMTEQEAENPLHRIRYAFALLQAGLGEKARQVVKQAIDLSPESADVYAAQAWILEHDILGRRFQAGYDREGALTAYKKALELDNENPDYHINCAILLEHDKEGFRFGEHADFEEAIVHYRYVYDDLNFKKIQSNLISILLHAEKYADLLSIAKEIDDKDLQSLITVVALVGEQGLEQGISELEKVNSLEKRKAIQLEASSLLFRVRHYKEAALLLRDAARYSSDAMQIDSRADVYQKLIQHEQLEFDEADPEALVKNFLHVFFTTQGDDFSALKEYVTEDFYANGIDEDNPYNFEREYNMFKHGVITAELPKDVCLDLYFSLMKLNRDGNKEDGYRIVMLPADNTYSRGDCFYIRSINGKLKIVANQTFISAIGKQAYDFYLDNQEKKAEKWLDWYYENFAIFQTDAKEVFQGRPFQKFWNPANRDIKLAAACIMAEGKFADKAEPILVNAYKQADTEEKKHNLNYALQLAYVNIDKYREHNRVLALLYAACPESDKIFYYYINSLINIGEYTKAEQIIQKHLALDSHDKQANCMLLRNYAYKLDFKALEKQMQKCIELNAISENEYNLVAWVELFNSSLNPKALEYARTAMKLSSESEDYIIHTMATLYAEVGRCQEAWQLINKVMIASGNTTPANADWYVFGRIAEQYGEIAEAITAYKRIQPPKNRPKDNISTYNLAQKRLKELKEK